MGKIELTKREFVWKEVPKRNTNWFNNDPIGTAFFDVLSILTASQEARILATLAHCKSKVTNPKLRADIDSLIDQEKGHWSAHKAYNDSIFTEYPGAREGLSHIQKHHTEQMKDASDLRKVTFLLFVEHYLGCLARTILSREDLFSNSEPNFSALWIFHMIEELEHSKVSFDIASELFGRDYLINFGEKSPEFSAIFGYDIKSKKFDIKTAETNFRWHLLTEPLKLNIKFGLNEGRITPRQLHQFFFDESKSGLILNKDSKWHNIFSKNYHVSAEDDFDHELINKWDAYLLTNGFIKKPGLVKKAG